VEGRQGIEEFGLDTAGIHGGRGWTGATSLRTSCRTSKCGTGNRERDYATGLRVVVKRVISTPDE
jgi:hypothetical protein